MEVVLAWLAGAGPFASVGVWLLLRKDVKHMRKDVNNDLKHLHKCIHRIEKRLDKHTDNIYTKLDGKQDKAA